MAALVLRPVPVVSEQEALTQKGVVTHIYEGSGQDVVFRLANTQCIFYINRGLESGLSIPSFKAKLVGKEVVLKYPDYWTPLDWNQRIKHLSKVKFEGKNIYDELK